MQRHEGVFKKRMKEQDIFKEGDKLYVTDSVCVWQNGEREAGQKDQAYQNISRLAIQKDN